MLARGGLPEEFFESGGGLTDQHGQSVGRLQAQLTRGPEQLGPERRIDHVHHEAIGIELAKIADDELGHVVLPRHAQLGGVDQHLCSAQGSCPGLEAHSNRG
jgi:hypothetical protein